MLHVVSMPRPVSFCDQLNAALPERALTTPPSPRGLCCVLPDDALGGEAGILVTLDTRAIDALQLAIDANVVRWAILAAPKLKLKPDQIRAMGPHQVRALGPYAT